MCDRASIKPLALSEDLDWENLNNDDASIAEGGVDAAFHSSEGSIEDPTIITVTTKIGDQVHTESVTATAQTDQAQTATAVKTPKVSNNKQSKRLLTVSGTASSQKKKKLDPFAIMSQLSGSLQELGSSNQVNEKMYELEKSYKSEELKLKGREVAILEKKSETELNLLKIKEKKELLVARKELKDLGVSQEEIDIMLPLH